MDKFQDALNAAYPSVFPDYSNPILNTLRPAILKTIKPIFMKKMRAMLMLAFCLLAGTAAFAQDAGTPPAQPTNRTAEVIASIPSLHSISLEISAFESKQKNSNGELKNANADLRALKMKYAAELEVQIAATHNAETKAVLTEELAKTRAEIESLK
jgi:hypothetical protein